VALTDHGDVALVGADAKDGLKGAAYLFVRRGGSWSERQKLQASDGGPDDFFGASVALSKDGDVALVGAPDGLLFKLGAAYVFVRRAGSWSERQKLGASDAAPRDFFGDSVALSEDGDVALAGARGKDDFTGAAYVFSAGED
jgi:hypothetical protein